MNCEPALEFRNVSFGYSSEADLILDQLSFSVEAGEFVSIIGPSGCGKSTIFRLVNQFLCRQTGEILVNGAGIEGRMRYCGYMPQQDLMFPWRTVGENVRLPLEIRGEHGKREQNRMVEEALGAVGLSGQGRKSPRELSGGMRQRAAFARTLLIGADLLLLDEPFSALDYLTRLSMREWLLEQCRAEKKTVLFITHDVEEAIFLSSRILLVETCPIRHLRSFPVPSTIHRGGTQIEDTEALRLRTELISLLRKGGAP